MLTLLSYLLLVLPLAAAGAIALAPARLAKWIATLGTTVVFVASVAFAWGFTGWSDGSLAPNDPGLPILPSLGVTLSLGATSVGVMLVLLTTFLMPLAMIGSFTAVREREKEYYAWFLVLEACMLGVFLARDAILFYTCFEFSLIPMYFLIAIYGGPERRAAAVKFFVYMFVGSIFTLAGIIYVAARQRLATGAWNFDIDALVAFSSGPGNLSNVEQFWTFVLLMAGFAVKVPFFPVHTWLPLAHDQAPTAGSVILAGSLLKFGTYGCYRLALPAAPVGVVELNQLIAVLCILGIVNAALICWVQHDVKKLIAYSSVSHLGFCMLGLFSLNSIGTTGSFMYMINHGLSTGAIFLCIGMIYERYHTKDMDQLGGLFRRMPVWSFFMIFFTMASLGLPGLNGFVGELLCLMGAFTAEPGSTSGYPGLLGPWYATVAALGLIAGAMYLLIMLGKLVWGPLREPSAHGSHGHDHGHAHAHGQAHASGEAALPRDLSLREVSILVPLAVACLVIGLYPKPMLEPIAKDVERSLAPYGALVRQHEAAGSLVWPEARDASGIARATAVGAPLKDIP